MKDDNITNWLIGGEDSKIDAEDSSQEMLMFNLLKKASSSLCFFVFNRYVWVWTDFKGDIADKDIASWRHWRHESSMQGIKTWPDLLVVYCCCIGK